MGQYIRRDYVTAEHHDVWRKSLFLMINIWLGLSFCPVDSLSLLISEFRPLAFKMVYDSNDSIYFSLLAHQFFFLVLPLSLLYTFTTNPSFLPNNTNHFFMGSEDILLQSVHNSSFPFL